MKNYRKQLASQTGKNEKDIEFNADNIREIFQKKLKHDDVASDEDDELEDISNRDESKQDDNPINDSSRPQQDQDIHKNEDEEGIYEGGDNEEQKFDSNRQKSSAIPKTGEKVFKTGLFNNNLFGKLASILIHDDEISYDGNYTEQVKATKKFKIIKDWRETNNVCSAFFSCKLRPNDYHVWISLVIAFLILVILAVVLSLVNESSEGVTWSVAFLHCLLSFGAIARPLACNGETNVAETIIYILSIVMIYAWGLVDLELRFDYDHIDTDSDNSTDADYFLVWYVTFIPFVTISVTCLLKWIDSEWKFGKFVTFSMIGAVIAGVICLVCCFIFIGPISGSIISGLVALIIYFAIIVRVYVSNDNYLPKWWKYLNYAVMGLVGIAALIVGIAYDELHSFLGWSISYAVFAGLICLDGLYEMASDIKNAEKEPIYFSPWVFPIFKYKAKKNDIELRNNPVILIFVALFSAYLWSFQCTIWITPFYYGIGISCLIEVLTMLFVLFLISFTPTLLADNKANLDRLLVKRSWLEAKTDYVNTKSITTPQSTITFKEITEKHDSIVEHLNKLKSDKNYQPSEEELKWKPGDMDKNDFMSLYQCRKYLYQVEQEKTDIYIDELSLIIHFEILLILHAQNRLRKDRKFLFKFIEVKTHALIAADIHISIPSKGRQQYKYAKVLSQIQKLPPEKIVLFRSLKEMYVQEELEKEDAIREQARIEQEKEEERQEKLAKMSEEKRRLLDNLDPNTPIDEMPDCELKYNKIVDRYIQNDETFIDTQFKADDSSLGPGCVNRGVARWVRASEMENCVLYKDQIDARDVTQGALGDCYFLSAMSVLGAENVKKIIKFKNQGNPGEWKCGAFWVSFYKNGQVEDVIIDDYFPVMGNGDFAFAKGGSDGKELWPAVLEKAYAKLNGSYNFIEAGKVQYALSDMTGGVSEQVELKKMNSNVDAFWERIKSLIKQGALMGAGSPENALGDSAINEYGIVQGHAYAVLGIVEVDEYKLINLRNPHGNRGIEWNGDWSDESEMWTQRAKNKCNNVEEVDGIFWMDFDDFLDNFSYLYICRVLDTWNHIDIEGEWQGPTAEGLPSSENRTARLELNPQYEIKVASPGPLFIQMNQFEKENMFKGKHYIFFMVQNIGGKKIKRMDRKAILGMSGQPTNLNVISSEINLTKKLSFPVRVTLLAANTKNGKDGEAKFAFKVYARSRIDYGQL